MLWILEDSGQRISEYRNCLLKRNTVLYLICLGFLGIPFKLKRHPLEILSRCSSALSHGPRENIDVHRQIQFLTELKMQASSPVPTAPRPRRLQRFRSWLLACGNTTTRGNPRSRARTHFHRQRCSRRSRHQMSFGTDPASQFNSEIRFELTTFRL